MLTITSDIRDIQIDKEGKTVFPLIQQLHPHLDEAKFQTLMGEMVAQGYRMIGLYVEEKLVAVAGFSILTNLYLERHLYLYDLVSEADERSKGNGKKLLSYLHELSAEKGCKKITLSSRFDRVDAIRFYVEKMGYEKTSYVINYSL